MTSEHRAAARRELGSFLRARRERTTPEEMGLPGSPRRRTPGLRREELAVLAGVSTTWYAYLEQGRDVHPSDQVLAAIANALRLTGAERTHLRALADGTAREPLPAAPAPAETVAAPVAAIPALVAPAPAYITGATTDVLVCNDAATEYFPGLFVSSEHPNLARWVFLDPESRHVLVDWAEVAQSVLARLRTNAGRHPGDERFTRLAAELRAGSPEANAWWSRYDIASNRSGAKQIRHPTHGLLTLIHAAFTVADAPEQVLVVYSLP
ncbi:helix-turn-helix transcriptional regulator [Nocardia terpenica]|uniref:Transcriptional regulator n=1 Tax=Nocardia terpenica TaxID=455432 RepID=A0A161WEG7_9NOCA|nr:helix-turn-helix transcriptional regulator [Nocardia terpenica]KZM75319.1 transcriptional regulator [Nocardia terpenica]NQE85770.1 helix-turn-helix domain-containing protein [Nocardia terpenica]